VAIPPFNQSLFSGSAHRVEILKQGVTEFIEQLRAECFVSRGEAERLDCTVCELAVKPKRTLDGDLPVAEGLVGKDLRLWGFFESKEHLADTLDIFIREFAVLLAQILSERLEPLRRVDELHLSLARLRFAIAQYPHVGRDT